MSHHDLHADGDTSVELLRCNFSLFVHQYNSEEDPGDFLGITDVAGDETTEQKRWDDVNYWGENQQKMWFLSSPIPPPPFNLLSPTFLPLTQPVWNWKTRVWKGGIYMGLHGLIKSTSWNRVHVWLHVCVPACTRVCFSPRQTTRCHFPSATAHGHMVVTSAAEPWSCDLSHKSDHHRHTKHKKVAKSSNLID